MMNKCSFCDIIVSISDVQRDRFLYEDLKKLEHDFIPAGTFTNMLTKIADLVASPPPQRATLNQSIFNGRDRDPCRDLVVKPTSLAPRKHALQCQRSDILISFILIF